MFREYAPTIDDVLAYIQEQGHEVSRSAVGRYKQDFEKVAKRMREAREVAQVWVAKLGDEPQGDIGRLVIEVLRTLVFQISMDEVETGGESDAKSAYFLSKSIKELETAARHSAEREINIRKRLEAELEKKLADAAERDAVEANKSGKKKLDTETLAEMRRIMFGTS